VSPIFFNNQSEFRQWLEKNYARETELLVGYYRVETGKPSMTWSQSVDQALCFGWIDGIRKKVDGESYCIRFTPRKRTSKWSHINIAKVQELTRLGLMHPAGLEAFSHCKEANSGGYSFENEVKTLPEEFENKFRARTDAWEFYSAQPPSYRKMVTHWLLSARQKATQIKRLEELIQKSSQNTRLFNQYRRPGKQ
jgi:uncharacterized protein YdeI (YjbR/CyaY-like superfamily)